VFLFLATFNLAHLKAQPELIYCNTTPLELFDSLANANISSMPIGDTLVEQFFDLAGYREGVWSDADIGPQVSDGVIVRTGEHTWNITIYAYFDLPPVDEQASKMEVLHRQLFYIGNEWSYQTDTSFIMSDETMEVTAWDIHHMYDICKNDTAYAQPITEISGIALDTLDMLINGLFMLSLQRDPVAIEQFRSLPKLFPAVRLYDLHHYYMSAKSILCCYGLF
jgi:hypothetical protein